MAELRDFEVPLIITVRAASREDAGNEASDLADSIAETFQASCTAIIADDHNVFDRLGIRREGASTVWADAREKGLI